MESLDFQSEFRDKLHKGIIVNPKPAVIRRATKVDKGGSLKVPDVKPFKVPRQGKGIPG